MRLAILKMLVIVLLNINQGTLMQHRIGMAIICLHISAALYLLVGVGMFLFFRADAELGALAVGMLAFCIVLMAGIEVVVWGLKKRKFWAWIAGLCVFAMYAPSLFIVLGGLGLWGLLDPGSRREFGVGVPPAGFDPIIPEAKQL